MFSLSKEFSMSPIEWVEKVEARDQGAAHFFDSLMQLRYLGHDLLLKEPRICPVVRVLDEMHTLSQFYHKDLKKVVKEAIASLNQKTS